MSEAEVINYMRQICEAVKHMHEKNIIHLGELKPCSVSKISTLDKMLTDCFAFQISNRRTSCARHARERM